ncbi:MAG: ABC transporter permease [Acidobacteria bacterium]|nr:MAG: ABC transporter permease [Acidobacteriota bacterium]
MRALRAVFIRLGGLFNKKCQERELAEELESHLQLHIEDNLRAGLSPEEARREALVKFGALEATKEACRDRSRLQLLDTLSRDFRYAARTLRKNPGFTAVVVLSLGLGIGANTAVFTFVDAALLKPLPYPNADRIVALLQRPLKGKDTSPVAPRSFVRWQDRARSMEALAIAQVVPINTQGVEGAEQVSGLWTTSKLFEVFGVKPMMGRLFEDQEGLDRAAIRAESESSQVVILSHGYWQRRFGSNPDILGKTIPTGHSSATIIGILPAGFRVGTLQIDLFLPIRVDRANPDAIGSRGFQCFGLLRRGVTVETAQAEMTVLAEQIGRELSVEKDWRVVVLSLRDYLVRDNRLVLLVLLAVVGFVLLIACANLAGLLLTRGVGRRSELALRASLGAGRGRLVQQLLVESLTVSILGGVLGLLLGFWASRALVILGKEAVEFGQMAQVHLDVRVLSFTLGLSLLTAIVFGLAPAWQISRFDLRESLKAHGQGADSRSQQRFRAAMVVGEVALAVVLLVGAGLLLRTFSHLLDVKLGFRPEQVLTMRMIVRGDPAFRSSLVEDVLDRVESLPEVHAVGTIQFLPLSGWTNNGPFYFVGRPKPADPKSMESDVSTVSRGYFAAMGIPVLRGRPFTREDRLNSRRVALVNQSFVNRFCPGLDPIGQVIMGDWANPKPTEIIGVVGDIRHNGLAEEPRPTVFLAQAQVPGYITYLVVRASGEPMALAHAVRKEVADVDPTQAVTAAQPMEQYVSAALVRPKLYSVFLGFFSALALMLAAIGLYGLMAYAVSRRTHEIGIRMALGARPGAVLRSTLRQGGRLISLGLVLGVACSLVFSRFVASLLYGVTTGDLTTYLVAGTLLTGIALVAAYIPARRASKVDPMIALRYE